MSTNEEMFTDLMGMLGKFGEEVSTLLGGGEYQPYTDAEATQIRAILKQLTIAQIKDRFVGYGVRPSTLAGMRKDQMIDYLIVSKEATLDGMPRYSDDNPPWAAT